MIRMACMDANEAALVDKTEMERYLIRSAIFSWLDRWCTGRTYACYRKIETLLSTHEGREQLESFLKMSMHGFLWKEWSRKLWNLQDISEPAIADLDRKIHFPPWYGRCQIGRFHHRTNRLCPLHWKCFADGKFRIYEYFMDLHNQKENADFLKNMGLVTNPVRYYKLSSSNSEHDAKGILLEKEAFKSI